MQTGARGRSAAKRTIIGGLEAAPGSTPFVDTKAHQKAGAPRPEPAPVSVPDAEPAPVSKPEPEWTVAVTDEQHEELDTHEVVALYASGTIHEETFIWKDGMDDWAMPFEIPAIARALEAAGHSPTMSDDDDNSAMTVVASSSPDPSAGMWREPGSWNEPPVAPGADFDDVGFEDVTVSMAAPVAAELLRAAEARDAAARDAAARSSTPTKPPPSVPGQSSYSRDTDQSDEPDEDDVTVMRQAPSELLLGGPQSQDVTVNAPSPMFSAEGELLGQPRAIRPAAGTPAAGQGDSAALAPAAETRLGDSPAPGSAATDQRPAGARNESSVLFSLDALTKQESRADQSARPSEDVFMMSPSAPVDQADASALAAPDFSAPLVEAPSPPSAPRTEAVASEPTAQTEEAPSGGGSGVLWFLLVLVLLGGGGFASYHFRYPPQLWNALLPLVAPTATPAPGETPAASATGSAAPGLSAGAAATAAAPEADAGAAPATSASAAPSAGAAPTTATSAAGHYTWPIASAKPSESASAAPTASAAPAASAAPPFNKGAAAAAMSGAAQSAASCKKPGTPAGTGRVSVTFMPSGRATNAIVTGDFAGTAVGGCVARLFRNSKVPAFSGGPVTVSKSFVIH